MTSSDQQPNYSEPLGHDPAYAPGTEILYDSGTKDGLHGLQHVRNGDSHILLVPQPSLTDPNDPLRWSTARKWATLLNGMWYSYVKPTSTEVI